MLLFLQVWGHHLVDVLEHAAQAWFGLAFGRFERLRTDSPDTTYLEENRTMAEYGRSSRPHQRESGRRAWMGHFHVGSMVYVGQQNMVSTHPVL